MENIIISMEATCDLPQELVKKYGFKVFEMEFCIDDKIYSSSKDDAVSSQIYEKMKKGSKTQTSQINETLYTEFFEELLKQHKKILHIGFSSGLSGTFESAKKAAAELNKKEQRIFLIDSKTGSCGQGLLGILAYEFAKKASSFDDLMKYITEMQKRLKSYFTVENLKYLANGGRIKPTKAFIGNLLNIKPIIKADDAGKLKEDSKVISRKKSLQVIADKCIKDYDKTQSHIFVAHAGSEQDANTVANMVLEKTGIKPDVYYIGPVMGSHCGPGTIAIFFVANTI